MATAGVAENVAEAAEVVAEEARGFTSRELTLFAAGCLWGTAWGCVSGYFWAKRRFELRYMQMADEEIAAYKDYMKREYVKPPIEEKPDLAEKVKELGYDKNSDTPVAYHKVESEQEVEAIPTESETKSVFEVPQPTQEEVEPEWDWAKEVKSRTDDDPFIIHRDEWNTGEMDYEQASLTYFEGDDVLADERDKIIEDQDEVIGLGNMLKWGHGSGDPNMLFIRNPKLGMDLEVTRSMGTYASEVHGLEAEDELQHSGHRVRPRRRFDDDERA